MIKIEVHSTRAVIRSQEPLTVGLKGATVRFSFGEHWGNLIKTAVFRQGEKTVTVAVADVGTETIIPWEVLTVPGQPVQIGLYGTDSSDSVVIPTVWAITKPVQPGTDPEGDPSTEPTPGLWEQLQGKLGSLEQLQTEDKTNLVAAINEANRAVFVVSVSGSDDVYALDCSAEELKAATTAGKCLLCFWEEHQKLLSLSWSLETASAFEFGAVAGNTEYQLRLRILASGEINISGRRTVLATEQSKLPNPQKLAFTGAVEEEYDGSEALQVEIPSKTSQLTNDSDFISRDEVAKQIPTLTSQLINDSGFLTKDLVTSVNGQVGAVTIDVPVTSVNGQVGNVTVPTAVKVTVSQTEDGKYTADLYCAQLLEAYNQGCTLYCEFGTRIFPLLIASRPKMVFGCVYAGNVYQIDVGVNSVSMTVRPLLSGDGSGSLTITDDGNGNVTITTVSGSSITDETSE